jgi:hypothetical protein
VRAPVVALALLALVAGWAPVAGAATRVAFFDAGNLVVLDLASGRRHVAMNGAPVEPLAWSGDGKLLSVGGRIVGGPTLHTPTLAWAPTGETAAYQTRTGAVDLWSPGRGSRTILAPGWGVTSLAWGPGGVLAFGRATPSHDDVWTWKAGRLTRVAVSHGPSPRPLVAGVDGGGRVLWWDDLESSGSIAADGLVLSANGTKLATTLVFPDYVSVCGSHLALAAGRDRYTTHGKSILLDGRDVSRDPALSWVSPSCNAGGLLVAAAGRNWYETRIGQGEHRSIWELAPRRVRLTSPPAGWTDENPRALPDGGVLFVRTRETSSRLPGHWTTPSGAHDAVYVEGGWKVTDTGKLGLAHGGGGRVRWLATTSWTNTESGGYETYYGHYGWPWLVAVAS